MTNKPKKPEIICLKSAKSVDLPKDNLIVIGQIRKTVGLKGWLRVSLMTDFPDRFEPGEELCLRKQNGSSESVIVSEWRPHYSENTVDILLEGIDTRRDGLSWVIQSIWDLDEEVDLNYMPNFLDVNAINYLFTITKKINVLNNLRKYIERFKLDSFKTFPVVTPTIKPSLPWFLPVFQSSGLCIP